MGFGEEGGGARGELRSFSGGRSEVVAAAVRISTMSGGRVHGRGFPAGAGEQERRHDSQAASEDARAGAGAGAALVLGPHGGGCGCAYQQDARGKGAGTRISRWRGGARGAA